MMKQKNYNWSELLPIEGNLFQIKLAQKDLNLIGMCSDQLVKYWQMDEKVAKKEIETVSADYTFSQLYLLGNDDRIKTMRELSKLHHFIESIDDMEFDRFYIELKAIKNKKHINLRLETDFIRRKLLASLRTLQNPKMDNNKVGRPNRSSGVIEAQKFCAKSLNKRYSGVIKGVRDRYYFIGIIMIGAGIFTEWGLDHKEYLITKTKTLIREMGKETILN